MNSKILCIFLIIILCKLNIGVTAQNIDSLEDQLRKRKEKNGFSNDTITLNTLLAIGKRYSKINRDTAINYYIKAEDLAAKLHDTLGLAEAINMRGWCFKQNGDFKAALEIYKKCLNIVVVFKGNTSAIHQKGLKIRSKNLNNMGNAYLEINDYFEAGNCFFNALEINKRLNLKDQEAANLANLAIIYQSQGDYLKSLDFNFKALKIQEEVKDKFGIPITISNIAIVYEQLKDFDKALKYYFKSLSLYEKQDERSIALVIGNISNVYTNKGDYENALLYLNRAVELNMRLNDITGLALNYNNLGILHTKTKDYKKAVDFFSKAIDLNSKIPSVSGQASVLSNMGSLYIAMNQKTKALQSLNKSIGLFKQLKMKSELIEVYENLTILYEELNQPKKALEMYKLHVQYKDSIFNESNIKLTAQRDLKYQFDKKSATDSTKVAEEKKITTLQLKQEKEQRYVLYGGLTLVALFGAFMFNRFRVTRNQKKIIELKEQETHKQNLIIKEQKHLVEEKQKEIIDSIRYAKRIQQSLMPTPKYISKKINELKG